MVFKTLSFFDTFLETSERITTSDITKHEKILQKCFWTPLFSLPQNIEATPFQQDHYCFQEE